MIEIVLSNDYFNNKHFSFISGLVEIINLERNVIYHNLVMNLWLESDG